MSSITDQPTAGRGKSWAYLGAVVGGGVSVAANVAHSFRPPTGAAQGWSPQGGAVALAAFWPLALLLAVEVMVRVGWPGLARWTVVRFGGVTPVAVVAAIVSYRHLSGLLDWYGEDGVTVALGPLAVDGLMVVSTGALLALASRSDRVPGIGSGTHTETIESGTGSGTRTDESDQAESIGSVDRVASVPDRMSLDEPCESPGASGGAVVSIESHRHTGPSTQPVKTPAARPRDVEQIKEALRAGQLSEPLRVKHVMDHLSIGPAYARAAIDNINSQEPREHAQA